MILCSCF